MTPRCALCCCLQLAAPIGLAPLTPALPLSTFPPQAVGPIAHSHLVPSHSLPGLPLPPYSPFLSLRRLCQQSPRTVPVSLFRVGSTRWRATALAVGQACPSGHPQTGGGGPLPNSGCWAPGCPLVGSAHDNLPPVHSRAQASLWQTHHVRGGGGGWFRWHPARDPLLKVSEGLRHGAQRSSIPGVTSLPWRLPVHAVCPCCDLLPQGLVCSGNRSNDLFLALQLSNHGPKIPEGGGVGEPAAPGRGRAQVLNCSVELCPWRPVRPVRPDLSVWTSPAHIYSGTIYSAFMATHPPPMPRRAPPPCDVWGVQTCGFFTKSLTR